jgi:hypothetical protein
MPARGPLEVPRAAPSRGSLRGLLASAAMSVLGLSTAACPSPSFSDCEVRCDESGVCPSGLECGPGGYCYRELPAAGADSCPADQDAGATPEPDAGGAQEPDGAVVQEPDAGSTTQGQFTLLWRLVRDDQPATCDEVGAETISVVAIPADQPESGYDDVFDCPPAETEEIVLTGPLPLGEYTVSVTPFGSDDEPVHPGLTKQGSLDGGESIVDLGFFELAFD